MYVYVYAYLSIGCGSQYQCFSVWTVSCMRMCFRVHMYAYTYVCRYIYVDVYVGVKTHLWNIHTCPCTSAQNTCMASHMFVDTYMPFPHTDRLLHDPRNPLDAIVSAVAWSVPWYAVVAVPSILYVAPKASYSIDLLMFCTRVTLSTERLLVVLMRDSISEWLRTPCSATLLYKT